MTLNEESRLGTPDPAGNPSETETSETGSASAADQVEEIVDRLSDSAILRPFAANEPMLRPLAEPEEIWAALLHKPKALPTTLTLLLLIEDSSRMPWKELAEMIEADAELSRHFTDYISSNSFTSVDKVRSVSHAVSLLHAPKALEITLALSYLLFARKFRLDKSEKLHAERYLRHVLVAAMTSLLLREEMLTTRVEPEKVFAATLMQKVGVMALQFRFPALYKSILTRHEQTQEPLHKIERMAIQTDHGEAGARLLEHWGLPKYFSDSARYHLAESCEERVSDVVPLTGLAHTLTTARQIGVVKERGDPEIGLHVRDLLWRVKPEWARGESVGQLMVTFGERIGLRDNVARSLLHYLEGTDDLRLVPEEPEEEMTPPEEETPAQAVAEVLRKAQAKKDAEKAKALKNQPKTEHGKPLLFGRDTPRRRPARKANLVEYLIPGLAQMRLGSLLLGRLQYVTFGLMIVGMLAGFFISHALMALFFMGLVLTSIWSMITLPGSDDYI